VSFHTNLSAMGLFTSILISIVASVVGVQADETFWKTSTEIAWSSKAVEANTVWSTQTYTQTAWSTYIPPAVTISVPYTVTSVLEKDYTTTLTRVVISTVTQPVTVKQPTTITIPPITVTVFTTSSLTGLVTCPTRVINPTYTTSTPLPDDYTWGCPPGSLCRPPQIDCNFEQNPPADSYYCSPDECVSVSPISSFAPAPTRSGTCGPYPTISGYFNFDPEYFGLSYSIFVDGGDYAETCSGCPLSTIWPISQISDGQPQAPTVVPVCEITSVPLVTTISDGQPQGPVVTAPARLARRAELLLPSECFDRCNQCLLLAENDGKQRNLCISDSLFSAAYGNCEACLSIHKADTKTEAAAVLETLGVFTSYCNSVNKVVVTPAPASTTSAQSSSPTSTSQKVSPTSSSPSHSASASSPTSVSTSKSSPVPVSTPPSSTSSQTSGSVCAVSQISDGQPQECTSIVSAVSQISDGQPQAPTSASSTAPATFSGAAGRTLSPPSIFRSSPMGWVLLLFVNALPI
jgi:hypothetical protein